jgi:Cys-tRNA(Pro)/Cys-tRNA(Cys) deacylase
LDKLDLYIFRETIMATQAIQFLEQKNIPFEVVKYNHEKKGAEFASRASGFPLERTIKTLVVDLGEKQYALVLVPGDQQLSMKRLAGIRGVKRAAMADTQTAERITGYRVGGISPFGTRQKMPVIMEESMLEYDKVLVNAGQRGMMLKIAPIIIPTVLACELAAVGQ